MIKHILSKQKHYIFSRLLQTRTNKLLPKFATAKRKQFLYFCKLSQMNSYDLKKTWPKRNYRQLSFLILLTSGQRNLYTHTADKFNQSYSLWILDRYSFNLWKSVWALNGSSCFFERTVTYNLIFLIILLASNPRRSELLRKMHVSVKAFIPFKKLKRNSTF